MFNKLFLIIIVTIKTLISFSQLNQITIQIDMNNEIISPLGVHIAGDFQSIAGLGANWDPSSTEVFDNNGDGIYSITLYLPDNTYEYKFINGNAWGMDERPPAECTVGSNYNRYIVVSGLDLTLPAVRFDECLPTVNFSINMKNHEISPDGVYIMGDFQKAAGFSQDWASDITRLEDLNSDKSYEISLQIPEGDYEYLFLNGMDNSNAESLPSNCFNSNNRKITINPGNNSPETHCFNSCDECDPYLTNNFKTHWWNNTVFYELFIRSFYDSNGDGIGDFKGITEKLDYLNDGDPNTSNDLGITGIWLMPMMESPSYHGYDVSDYYEIEVDYGTMEDFEEFLEQAHLRGIKVIIDLVLNHTSNQHPWFIQSANNQNNYRDWYIWSESNPGFTGPWGQNIWHYNQGNYFYGLFWSGMPDLNYEHQSVKQEMINVANFWLNKGVDGFRLDAIKYLIEDPSSLENTPATYSLIEDFNSAYKYSSSKSFTIGEVWSNTNSVIPYVQNGRLDACFDFDLASNIINSLNSGSSAGLQQQILTIRESYPALQYGTFLTNHDMDRVYNKLGYNNEKMKLAASIYLTMPGIPFIYYGEELGMVGTGSHENIRRPMQWSSSTNAGFTNSIPWKSIGNNYLTNNVEIMSNNNHSLMNHYKKLIKIRNEQSALRKGNILILENESEELLSFIRTFRNKAVLFNCNLSLNLLNPTISLSKSSIPKGNYYLYDLYNNNDLGTLAINSEGGFESYDLFPNGLGGLESSIILLSQDSITNTLIENEIIISPNPTSNSFTIFLEGEPFQKALVTIFSSKGKLIFEKEMEEELLTINTKNWAKGIYIIAFSNNTQRTVKKVVIN
ncbi:MAG: hypothetical protein CL832_05945 [Crocinitomicaceae bacterium]|nr:hypothetical protein [Crocinitomicaceae bacterium]